MEASASKLVGNRFDGHNAVPFGFLLLIKLAGGFAISDRKVGSLDLHTCQKVVSVLGIAFALFLSTGDVGASLTAAIRRVISDIGKATDVAGLQQNVCRQDGTDAGYGQQ